jgi:hypothetical protein
MIRPQSWTHTHTRIHTENNLKVLLREFTYGFKDFGKTINKDEIILC